MKSSSPVQGIFLGFLISIMVWIGGTQRNLLKHEAETGVDFIDHGVNPNIVIGFHDRNEPMIYLIELQLINDGDEYETKCNIKRISTDEMEWKGWKYGK